ncbi:MAG TPA: ACP S-malonyltransferase [Solimonas sp.]
MTYAILFPGQGSQSVGMLGAHTAPVISETLQEASQVLGWDVAALMRDGPADEMNRTERTQPLLLAASTALWRLWQGQDMPAPTALAGHSLGEYSALVAAGALSFADALKLVELRGQLMQAAVPAGIGGMTALVGLDDVQVEALCGQWADARGSEGVLEPANYNAPGQVVVAGHVQALEWLEAGAKAAGARMAVRLSMSVPSHCSLLRPAAERLMLRLQETTFHAPVIPVLHNLDGSARDSADGIRRALCEQLYRPVRWTQTIRALGEGGHRRFLECGPGKVLCGLNKRILKEGEAVTLEAPEGVEKARTLVAG